MKDKKKNNTETTELTRTTLQPMTTVTPFTFMRRFTEDMDQLFEDFGGFHFPTLFGKELLPFRQTFEQTAWVPTMEVHHNDGKLTVHVDLPGLKKDDVKVEVTDDVLTISGERKEEKEEKKEGYYRSERTYGSFFREIPLPEGAMTNTATAEFKDGVLEITVAAPQREPHTRQLEIKHVEEPLKAKAAGR